MHMLTSKEAGKKLGVHPATMRRWADEGRVSYVRTPGGHRRYDIDELLNASGGSEPTTVCYCRVSGTKQRDDLERQVEYMQSQYPEAEVITDIGSGLNFKRQGLLSLLDRLHGGEKLTIVVAYRDRLARFGSELIERLIEQNGGELVVLKQVTHSPQEELAEDLHAILNVFSTRLQGLHRYSNQIKADPHLSQRAAEGHDS